jgi:hypothetical protein
MNYEECYRVLNVKNIINEEIMINWKEFINLVKKSNTPKKIIKILLSEKNYYNDLIVNENGSTVEIFNWLFNWLLREKKV